MSEFSSSSQLIQSSSSDFSEPFDEDSRYIRGVNRALLVATGRYCHVKDKTIFLNGVDPDVDLMCQCLTDNRCGFQEEDVKVLKTEDYPTLRKINKALDDVLGQCGERDFVFLYFSGHGFHEKDENIDYYLPFDVEPVFNEKDEFVTYKRESCFSFKFLREKIEACKARFVWVVVDACRVNAVARGVHRYALDSIGKLEATKSSLWFQSCGVGQESEERTKLDTLHPDCWHGYFTWYFCEGAKNINVANDDGVVTPNGLFKYIYDKLKSKIPQQTPMRDFKETALGECCFVDLSDESRIQAKKTFDEVKKLYSEGKYEQALSKSDRTLRQIDEVLKIEPENQEYQGLKKDMDDLRVRILIDQGAVKCQTGKWLEAIYDLDKVLQLDPKNVTAQLIKDRAKSLLKVPDELELPLWYSDKNDGETGGRAGNEYRLIRAGSFMMGSLLTGEEIVAKYLKGVDEEQFLKYFDNAPLHKVTLTQDFYLAKNLVTKEEFNRFVDETGYKTTAEQEGSAWTLTKEDGWRLVDGKSWRDPGFEQENDHPVVCVSYNDVLKYLAWLNETSNSELHELKPCYRLPTEAEWEYACRAGTPTEFFWGDEENDGKGYLNAAGTENTPNGRKWEHHFSFDMGYSATAPVGTFEQNPWGLWDMLGNVWEWTSDRYGDYPTGEVTNPEGDSKGTSRVLRGGSWRDGPSFCRCSCRGYGKPERRFASNGFRVAFSLTSK